jgi:hypothetical protein
LQRDIRDEEEDDHAYLVERYARIVDGIKRLYRYLEPSGMHAIEPIMRQADPQKPPQHQPKINNKTPQQCIAYYVDCHVTPPYYLFSSAI